ncbi:hypothetical protein IFM89_003318 [Coptis chinensis]|uniref:cysteine dioxygenase n=1 Tax=Coptis chinensis TaxID=261450 RepID=A0A835M8F5_9MAGN|nr:hypothetical protein IFM89_003318 [Coptis chinensis]
MTKISPVQALYDLCKKTFTTPTLSPSAQPIQKLCFLLNTIGPADVGLKANNLDDDRGHGFFGFNQFNRMARWAQPITYLDIHDCESFTAIIPLHDHPGMTVLSKILYGSMHVKGYDWVEPACIKKTSGSQVRLAKLVVDKVLTAPCETSALFPKHGGNIHCFTAVSSCAVLDILAPPYLDAAGRKCTYYHDYPYSSFWEKESENYNVKEEEYVWLKEIDTPEGLYMRPGKYIGPALQV